MADYSTLTSNLGLGAGLGLQANPKNYVPEAMRAEQFYEKNRIDQENRKLAAQAKGVEDEEKDYKEFMLNFKQPSTTSGAYSKARMKDVADAVRVYQEAKKDPKNLGKNVNADPRVMDAVNRALENERLRKGIEDRYLKQIDEAGRAKSASTDDVYVDVDEKFIEAFHDPTGEKMRQYNIEKYGEDTYDVPSNVAVIKNVQTNAMKLAAEYGARVQPDKKYIQTRVDKETGNTIKTISTEDWEKSKQEMWESFTKFPSFKATVDRNVREGRAASEEQAINDIKKVFDNSVRPDVAGVVVIPPKSYNKAFGNGSTTMQNVNIDGVKKGEDSQRYADIRYQNMLRGLASNLGITQGNNEPNDVYINRVISEADKQLGGLTVPGKKEKIPFSESKDWFNDQAKKGDYDAVVITRTDVAGNEPIKLINDNNKGELVSPIEITKIGGRYMIGADEYVVTKDEDGIRIIKPIRKYYSVDKNLTSSFWNDYGIGHWKVSQKTMDENFNKALKLGQTSDKVSYGKKKEQGGYAGKDVVKKFHDKTNKKTKLVFSDGTEEILNGIF